MNRSRTVSPGPRLVVSRCVPGHSDVVHGARVRLGQEPGQCCEHHGEGWQDPDGRDVGALLGSG